MAELGSTLGRRAHSYYQGLPTAPDLTQLPALTIRLLPKVGPDKVQNTGQYGAAATTKTKGQPRLWPPWTPQGDLWRIRIEPTSTIIETMEPGTKHQWSYVFPTTRKNGDSGWVKYRVNEP